MSTIIAATIGQLDQEIARLNVARQTLMSLNSGSEAPKPATRRGRPPKNAPTTGMSVDATTVPMGTKRKVVLSAEARKRIGDAVRARHARNKAANQRAARAAAK